MVNDSPVNNIDAHAVTVADEASFLSVKSKFVYLSHVPYHILEQACTWLIANGLKTDVEKTKTLFCTVQKYNFETINLDRVIKKLSF